MPNPCLAIAKIENLLTGLPFDGIPGCFLIRVKGACNEGDSKIWPDLIDAAMKATEEIASEKATQSMRSSPRKEG